MATKISAATVGEYLDYVTVLWFDEQRNLPPANVSDYLPYVEVMNQHARSNGELEHVKLAFEHLLTHPDIDCTRFDGSNYPYTDSELRAIIELAYKTIWRNVPLPSPRDDVEIVGEYLEDWRLQ